MSEARSWPPFLALGVIAAVLVGVPWGFKIAMAPELGEPCGSGFDCAPLDGRCVVGESGRYCTFVCETDADCPDSGHCGQPPHDSWRVWFSTSPMSETVCVPGPRPSQAPSLDARPGAKPGVQFRPPEQSGGASASE